MRSGKKSDLVKHTKPSAESANVAHEVTTAPLEGLVLVDVTKPKKNQSF